MKKNEIEKVLSPEQAFFIACESNNFESAFKLLLNIDNIDVTNHLNNYTGFIYAVAAKNYLAVQEFIKQGANVNVVAGAAPWKFTALKMLALQEFDVDIGKIFYLIWSRGGDITQLSSGESALTAIYQHDNYGLMNILLKHDEGENVLLGLSLSEVINDLQKLGKVGILKAFKENDLILPAEESIDSALDVSKSEARIADVELEVEAIGLNAI